MDTPPFHLNKINDKSLSIKVGDLLIYTFEQHSSVGYEGDFRIENEDLLQLTTTKIDYHTPERMKVPGITGADGASGQFVFKATQVGEVRLAVQQLFRSEIETELIFDITITH